MPRLRAAALPWGRVVRVVDGHPVGLVEMHVDQRRRAGWTRLPTLAAKSYHGILDDRRPEAARLPE